ncbi:MAG: S8 family serine peptidase [Bacteroidota bacterium]
MKKIKYLHVLVFVCAIPLMMSWQSVEQEWHQKVDDRLLEANKNTERDFLVMMADQANVSMAGALRSKEDKGRMVYETLKAKALSTQQPIVDILVSNGIKYKSFYIVNAIRAKGDLDLIQAIAMLPAVEKITENSRYKLTQPFSSTVEKGDPVVNLEWGVEKVRAPQVWEMGYEGEGVVVGGQDTGYEWFHPAIMEKYRGWDGMTADHNYNWHDAIHELNPLHMDTIPDANPCGLSVSVPCDDHNHGTHTMGTMVGRVDSNYIGIAPSARWIGCRNMDRGYGQPSTYIECFEWFLAPTDLNNANPDPSKAPHVIANSWSCPEMEGCNPSNFSLMQTAVENLDAAGVFVVVSAGNSGGQGCSTVRTPAAIFEKSFTVGASNSVDTLAWFSSKGDVTVDGSNRMKPDLVAPGVSVRSCIRNGNYATWNGTSMAGPHVAGVVALMISADPTLAGDTDRIRDILHGTTELAFDQDTCGGTPPTIYPNNLVGYGRVDALNAVNEALGVSTSLLSLSELLVKVYPNPFFAQIQIELTDLTGPTQLEVFDALGKVVYRETWDLTGNDLKVVRPTISGNGVYFYRIKHKDGFKEGKLVKL